LLAHFLRLKWLEASLFDNLILPRIMHCFMPNLSCLWELPWLNVSSFMTWTQFSSSVWHESLHVSHQTTVCCVWMLSIIGRNSFAFGPWFLLVLNLLALLLTLSCSYSVKTLWLFIALLLLLSLTVDRQECY
jgi:hypothetical protein